MFYYTYYQTIYSNPSTIYFLNSEKKNKNKNTNNEIKIFQISNGKREKS